MSEIIRFKQDKDFEEAMYILAGKEYIGCFKKTENPEFLINSLLKVNRILKRSTNKNKTMDLELQYSIKMRLNSIDKKIRKLSSERNDDWNIIANLLIIISLLYGFDGGKIIRKVEYKKLK